MSTKNKAYIAIIALLLMILCVPAILGAKLLSRNTYYAGVSVENISLDGLSREDAITKISEYVNEINAPGTFSLIAEGKKFNYNVRDIDFIYLVENAAGEAYTIGRTGGFAGRLLEIKDLSDNNKNVSIKYYYNKDKLMNILADLQDDLYVPEKSAKMFYKAGKYSALKETAGKKLNIDESASAFEQYINEKKFEDIPLIIDDVYPAARVENIKDINSVIASSTTSFSTQDLNRSYNIKYACQKLDGTVLMPGETFSMNNALGPRTLENGYKDAKVIMFDELVDGPGGGVCQVTTTLYVGVLKSLLSVTERIHHSFTLGYVPPGQDATIAENYIDFKFKNNKDYPVSISAETSGGNIIIRILGKKGEQYSVRLRSEIIEVMNPEPAEMIRDKSLNAGEQKVMREERQGKRVQVFREVYDKNGTLVEKTLVTDDIYRQVRGQIRFN